MAKHETNDEVGLRSAEKVCVRAYNYIAGHIMARKQEDYERAGNTRVAHYQTHVALCAKRGTAPPGEDPRAPIKPQLPTLSVAGAEVSPGEMMNWAMCWHISSIREVAIAATDTPMGVSSTDDVPQLVAVKRAAAKQRFDVIRGHVEYSLSPIDKVSDVPTHAFFFDQRDRAEDIMNLVGWIQKITIQKCADQHDTRRFVASRFRPEIAGSPPRDLPGMLLWVLHYNRICGHTPEFSTKWGVEMGLAQFAIGQVRFGIKGALPSEVHDKIAQLMLKDELMSNGKGPNSPSPAFSMAEFQNSGSIVHLFAGSELCIYSPGNRKYKADHDKKTVWNLPDVCNNVTYPGRGTASGVARATVPIIGFGT